MSMQLPDTIASPQDLTSLILELKEYAQHLSHDTIKQRVTGDRKLTPTTDLTASARELLGSLEAKNILTRDKVDALVQELEIFKKHAATLTITLAAPPTHELKKTLVSWCRKNLHKNSLINFQFSGSLLGGMVVRVGSRIYDWSLRRQILDQRAKFPEVLRRV